MTQEGSYELNWDRNLLIVTSAGFWDLDLMERYEAELTEQLRLAPASGFGFLVDLSESPPQDQKIVERQAATTDWIEQAGCHAIAMVIDSGLLRMQVRRAVAGRMPLEAYATRSEALTWLETKV